MISKVRSVFRRIESQSSWKDAAVLALRNPSKVWNYLRRSGSRRWIVAIFKQQTIFQKFSDELSDSRFLDRLATELNKKFSRVDGTTARGNRYIPGAMLSQHATALYAILRQLKPAIVVETGVCNGFSSAIILKALAGNQSGHLYSVDLPEFTGENRNQFWTGKGGAVVPQDLASGWLVPRDLRDRWSLQLGKSADILPSLLCRLDKIDLFVHDSEHSFENQLSEFRLAFDHLSSGGVIFATDINWSRAFDVFAKEVAGRSRRYFVDYSSGLVVRN